MVLSSPSWAAAAPAVVGVGPVAIRAGAFVRDTEGSLFSTDEWAGAEMHQMASFTLGAAADSSGVQLGSGGRDVLNPFSKRCEVGSFGLYSANWGGARKAKHMQDQLEKDLIADSPFQVITAQEVDKAFAVKLADSNVGGGWMVVTGDEESKTLLIGARASLAKEVKLLEWHRLVDGEYRARSKKKGDE